MLIVIMDVYHCNNCDTHFASENGKTDEPFCTYCDIPVYGKIKSIEVTVID